jgi:glycerophosphoryl diester phosphodiesterase
MWTQVEVAFFLLRYRAKERAWPQRQLILGHRGARAQAPENTLPSFERAMTLGADGVELDVFLSKDKVPVVIHDETLDRTTDGHGEVGDYTLAELKQFNAAKGWPQRGVTLPTLREVLEQLPEGSTINIELKGAFSHSQGDFVDLILQLIAEFDHKLTVIVSSFDSALLAKVRQKNAQVLIGLLLDTHDKNNFSLALKRMKAIEPDALHMTPVLASPWLVRLAKVKGLRVMLWTINDSAEAQTRLKAGVDGIFSDLPEGFIWTDWKHSAKPSIGSPKQATR